MPNDISVLYNDIDDVYDFVTINGDFAVVESTNQHLNDLLYSAPGDWKEYPALGADFNKYLNARLTPAIISAIETDITTAVTKDGAKVKSLDINSNDNTIEVNIEYLL